MARLIRLLAVVLALAALPVTLAARDWFSYCVDPHGDRSHIAGNARLFRAPEHHRQGGSGAEPVSVIFETTRRLKRLVASCTSGLEPICTLSMGEDPKQMGQPSGRWRYQLAGMAHRGAEFCVHAFAVH